MSVAHQAGSGLYRVRGGVVFTLHRTADTDVAARALQTRASGCIDRAEIGTSGSLCCAAASVGLCTPLAGLEFHAFCFKIRGSGSWQGNSAGTVALLTPVP